MHCLICSSSRLLGGGDIAGRFLSGIGMQGVSAGTLPTSGQQAVVGSMEMGARSGAMASPA